MPIYEYLCRSCGLEKEHLQKMNDALIEKCPECGSNDYIKQISAVGFQLKGSGWYVTDFKNKPVSKTETKSAAEAKPKSEAKGETTASTTAPAE